MRVAESKKFHDDPNSVLAEELLKSYLAGKGYTLEKVHELPPMIRVNLMTAASIYVSLKLAEIESRSRLKQKIHINI